MSKKSAEFVVLSGPERGRGIGIAGERAVVGRSKSECTIVLKEDYVSRRQLELERTAQGWVMRNVSGNGTLVNGKRYKAGAEILLDTGDVLGVGLETELLFVNAGADTDEAVRAWREKTASAKTAAKPPESPEAAAASAAPIPASATGADVSAAPASSPSFAPVSASSASPRANVSTDPEADAKKAKYKKYTIAAAIYFPLMFGVLVAVFIFRDRGGDSAQSGLERDLAGNMIYRDPAGKTPPLLILSADKIDQAIRARPAVRQDLTRARQELEKARGYYDTARVRAGGKYECIKHYKAYLAYRGSAMFEDSADELKFKTVLEGTNESRSRKEPDGLVPIVKYEYGRAVNLATDGRWREALTAFQKLLDMVPEQDPQDPTYKDLVSNINKWRELAQSKVPKKGGKRP